VAQAAHRIRHVELVERERLRRDGAEHAAEAPDVAEHVDAEARHARDRVGEVGAVLLLEARERLAGHDLGERLAHQLLAERLLAQGLQLAEEPDPRRVAGHEVQVGAAALEHLAEELVDAPRHVLHGLGGGDLAALGAHPASPCVTSALRMAVPSGTKRVNGRLSTA
jgi:hypothetical protein